MTQINILNREDLLALVTNKTACSRRDFVTSSLAPTKDGDIPAYRAMPASRKSTRRCSACTAARTPGYRTAPSSA